MTKILEHNESEDEFVLLVLQMDNAAPESTRCGLCSKKYVRGEKIGALLNRKTQRLIVNFFRIITSICRLCCFDSQNLLASASVHTFHDWCLYNEIIEKKWEPEGVQCPICKGKPSRIF